MSVLLYELGELYSPTAGAWRARCGADAVCRLRAARSGTTQSAEFAAAEAYWVKQFSDSTSFWNYRVTRPRQQ